MRHRHATPAAVDWKAVDALGVVRLACDSRAVKPGDTYRVTCTHDANLRTQLPQLKPLKPRYVVWGEGTSDEMCLGIVVWSAP